jgi:acyl-homoserine lactone acylase PvdQ
MKIGWMHTSSNVDVADMYAEKIVTKTTNYFMNTKKNLLPLIEENNSKLSRKRQTDTQNLYHLLHQSWSYNGKRDENGLL